MVALFTMRAGRICPFARFSDAQRASGRRRLPRGARAETAEKDHAYFENSIGSGGAPAFACQRFAAATPAS